MEKRRLKLLLMWWFLCGHAIAAETLVYKTADGRELRLHLEKPSDWKATDQRPAIVFFFGGGWVGGTPEQFRAQSEFFATRGMVGIRVEYRTLPKGDKGPPLVCCADAKSAIRYVRGRAAELGVDPARIAAAGGSAGGHLAAFTAMVDGLDDPADDMKISHRCPVPLASCGDRSFRDADAALHEHRALLPETDEDGGFSSVWACRLAAGENGCGAE